MNTCKGYSKMWFLVLLLVTFVTGCAGNGGENPGIIAPTVSATVPVNAATVVPIGNKLTVTFSGAMDPASINATTFTVQASGPPLGPIVLGTVNYDAITNTATFTPPASNLAANTEYTATITTGAKSLGGKALASDHVWKFTTGAAADTTPPTILSTIPVNADPVVATNSTVSATFSEAMDPLTITTTTFMLAGPGVTSVSGAVGYNALAKIATFTPASPLEVSTIYTATITTGVKDVAGNALASNKVWSFTTGTTAAKGPAAVNLGTAGNFVILAKTAVSTTGTTAVVGDIGLSPAAATFVTGFSLIADSTNTFSTSSLVIGKVYAADYAPPTPTVMTTAVSDMETAFTDAAGRTTPDFTELGAGDISGLTLVPGLYKWGTAVSISNVGVIISGGANDVWIFQIAQDLTVANSAIVTLQGGAQAKNIFWQVAGQATLGTAADFKGIILSQTLISLNTGAVMTGRALAQSAVTLDATAITAP